MKAPAIGAFVLDTLTTGMYTNPLDALRELVQNSSDSIHRAEHAGAIQYGAGRVQISLDPSKRTVVIEDNGTGIPSSEVFDRLVSIGLSDKSIGVDTGFRGIGRLAATAYCRHLRFETSSAGERTRSCVEVDCEGLRTAVSPKTRRAEELARIIADQTHITQDEEKAPSRYFRVTMDGISAHAMEFLDSVRLEEYLSQTVPVQYDAQRFMFAPKIHDWVRDHGLSLPTVTLTIKTPTGERQVFKPYKGWYNTRQRQNTFDIEVKDICFYPEDAASSSPFWIWFAKTDLLGMIDSDQSAGFRIRKNNFALDGPEAVAELFGRVAPSNRRFNAYYIGEIHVSHPDAIPNARRDGFEEVDPWPTIRDDLLRFIEARCEDVRSTSEARNRPTAKVIATAESVIKEASQQLETGFVSAQQREALLDKVKREEARAAKALSGRSTPPEAAALAPVVAALRETRTAVENRSGLTIKTLKANLDRKQRKIVSDILQILYETLDSRAFQAAKEAILSKYGEVGVGAGK